MPFFAQSFYKKLLSTKLLQEASFQRKLPQKKNHIDTCVKKDKLKKKEGPIVWLDESKSQTLH